MNAELDPNTLDPLPGRTVWSDYDGDDIYGDWKRILGNVREVRSFEPGIARVSFPPPRQNPSTAYYHSNLIGTTRLMTDENAAPIEAAVYTAFGKLLSGTANRYGYAGSWGYQTDDDFPDGWPRSLAKR